MQLKNVILRKRLGICPLSGSFVFEGKSVIERKRKLCYNQPYIKTTEQS